MAVEKPKTLSVTGKRPLKLFYREHAYKPETWAPIYAAVQDAFHTLTDPSLPDPVTRILTGGAQGADQTAFWAAHFLKKERPNLENIIYVPFLGQESRWMDRGLFGQQEYRHMLEQADAVRYRNRKSYEAAELLFLRNKDMIDDSSITLVISHKNGILEGGTGHACRYTVHTGNQLLWLDTETYKVTILHDPKKGIVLNV